VPLRRLLVTAGILSCLSTMPSQAAETVTSVISASRSTNYKIVTVKGLNIFYREAGPSKGPAILLLHGFPSSSRMFDTLMPLLADRYHLIAPDCPGFGNSEAPSPEKFFYTFDAIADIVGSFTEAIHLDRYALYLQNYGGPVGYRVAVAHPERVTTLIIQNAVAHEEGLGRLQAVVFDVAEVQALKRDLPKADVHLLDAGHFALDESADDVARLMRNFLARLPHRGPKPSPHI
jgi:pimeloyl-ACP methyl ester carboxylesterase